MTGSELRATRDALGMTQAALGLRLGIPANTIAKWERGEQRIRHPLLLRLALERLAMTTPAASA